MDCEQSDDDFSLNGFTSGFPEVNLLVSKSQPLATGKSQVKASRKQGAKDRKRIKISGKPVKQSKRMKMAEGEEKPVNALSAQKSAKKDTQGAVNRKAHQKKEKSYTKNGKVSDVTLQAIDEPVTLQDQKSFPDPNLNRRSSDLNAGERKSLRLRKKESNLEECKGCTCKKSQCIKLYCECFLSQGYCSPS